MEMREVVMWMYEKRELWAEGVANAKALRQSMMGVRSRKEAGVTGEE